MNQISNFIVSIVQTLTLLISYKTIAQLRESVIVFEIYIIIIEIIHVVVCYNYLYYYIIIIYYPDITSYMRSIKVLLLPACYQFIESITTAKVHDN